MSHTPGPWKVTLAWSQQTGDTYSIEPHAREEQMEIDAHLIEAAPELLAIVKWAVERDGECLGDHQHMLEAALAAIAKAEGR